jgi:hypothetical protein
MTIGAIQGYTFRILGDEVSVVGNGVNLTHRIPNYGTGIQALIKRSGFAVGWTRTDDFETICFYDKNDGNYGYCLNVTWPEYSEWGYMFFG